MNVENNLQSALLTNFLKMPVTTSEHHYFSGTTCITEFSNGRKVWFCRCITVHHVVEQDSLCFVVSSLLITCFSVRSLHVPVIN